MSASSVSLREDDLDEQRECDQQLKRWMSYRVFYLTDVLVAPRIPTVYGEIAMSCARANLDLVVKALRVDVMPDGYYLTVGDLIFKVIEQGVIIVDKTGRAIRNTCIRNPGMPGPELIATTLLLLHNDPTIFDKWAEAPGIYFGA